MKARSLDAVFLMPVADRLPVLAEGLSLLSEHVETLRLSVAHLVREKQPRAAAIIDSVALEEAAKILILLDLVRTGWADQVVARRQIGYFTDHLARGIYAEMANARPATYKEVREMIEECRPSRYLDGPNDIDWVFRNRIETKREETFYVDYVRDDEGYRWVSPESGDRLPLWWASKVTELTRALALAGLLSVPGLEVVSAVWRGVRITDETHWVEVRSLNHEVLVTAQERSLVDLALTPADLERVREQWTFPLSHLDLRKRDVPDAELDAARARGEAMMLRDWAGGDDEY